MTKISATIVADSINEQGDRLTSLLITFPRILLSEINTHRMLSKNTSSSRAIPFKKMVESVQNDPFIPIAWQKSHSGMQGTEYITDLAEIQGKRLMWLAGRDRAIQTAKNLHEAGVTKQLANRLLEPFMWTTMLITGPKSGWDNFFNLRCPQYYFEPEDKAYKSRKEWIDVWNGTFETGKDVTRPAEVNDWDNLFWLKQNKGQAEIHMMALAECIYDAYNESTPKKLQAGEWHIPFKDRIDENKLDRDLGWLDLQDLAENADLEYSVWLNHNKIKISTAMAARTSYTVVGEEKEIDYKKMIELHDRLLSQDPPHSSPLEHCAKAMSDEEYDTFYKGQLENKEFTLIDCKTRYLIGSGNQAEHGWCNNFKGFIPYRYMIDNAQL